MIYSFQLDEYEEGTFSATCHPDNVCRANSDAEALELSRLVALEEWAAPDTRAPEDFAVEFFDSRSLRLARQPS